MQAGAAQAPGRFQRGRALLGERRPTKQVDVGIEDEGHDDDHAVISGRIDGGPGPEVRAECGLHRSGEVEDPEEGEADDIGGDGQGQDQRPLEEAPAGEGVVDDEPGQGGPEEEGPHPYPRQEEERVHHEREQLGVKQVRPHLDGRHGHRGEHDRDGYRQHHDDADRGDSPRGPGVQGPGASLDGSWTRPVEESLPAQGVGSF